MEKIVCPVCSNEITGKHKRSFWGLLKISCDHCNYEGETPFSGVYRGAIIVLASLPILGILIRLAGNMDFSFGILELFGYLAIVALIKNLLVQKKIDRIRQSKYEYK